MNNIIYLDQGKALAVSCHYCQKNNKILTCAPNKHNWLDFDYIMSIAILATCTDCNNLLIDKEVVSALKTRIAFPIASTLTDCCNDIGINLQLDGYATCHSQGHGW